MTFDERRNDQLEGMNSGGREGSMRETMTEAERVLAMNRAGWDCVAPRFYGATALPEYGPLAPTEESLSLLDLTTELCALELGCGSGHSLRYLAQHGVRELWGVDLSPVQIAFARETLQPFASRCRLFESPMEVNPGIPTNYFDLVFSIWGMGWTTDLRATLALVAEYLRPGGSFLVSGEHPAFGRLDWNGTSSRSRIAPKARASTPRGRACRSSSSIARSQPG
jgi:SAM-dependent methyltransferase